MLGNRTAGRNDVLRAAVRPTAPVNPSVKIAVKLSAYQCMSTFLVILPVCIFNPSLKSWAHVALGGASAHFQKRLLQ